MSVATPALGAARRMAWTALAAALAPALAFAVLAPTATPQLALGIVAFYAFLPLVVAMGLGILGAVVAFCCGHRRTGWLAITALTLSSAQVGCCLWFVLGGGL